MIYLIIFSVVYSLLDAWHDYYYITNNQKWHFVDSIIKTYVFIGILLIDVELADLSNYIFLMGLMLSIRWIVFDLSLNIIRRKPLLYTGQNNIQDKYFKGWLSLTIKLISLIIFLILSEVF